MLYLALSAVALGVLVGWLRGGHLTGLLELRLRGLWFAVVPLALQIGLFATPLGAALGPLQGPAHLFSYALLIVPLALNLHVAGMRLLALGLALNAAVIAANGGFMPVSAEALEAAGIGEYAAFLESSQRPQKSILMTESTRLAVLGDWLPVRLLGTVVSPGDLAIVAGGLTLVAVGMGRRRG